jgi:hypothetical protein
MSITVRFKRTANGGERRRRTAKDGERRRRMANDGEGGGYVMMAQNERALRNTFMSLISVKTSIIVNVERYGILTALV